MNPASAPGSFGEVPGNQAWCGGGIPGSHRWLGGVPCVVSKTTAGSPLHPTSLCLKDRARAEGSHLCGPRSRDLCRGLGSEAVTAEWHSRGILHVLCVLMMTQRGLV